jgi:hypothetical protein
MTFFHRQTLISEVKTAIQVALIKEKDIHAVAGDKQKMQYAVAILLTGVVLPFLGRLFFMPQLFSIGSSLLSALSQAAMTIIGIYILSYIAQKLFKGQAKHDAFFRAMAYSSIVGWLAFIPILGWISAIWAIVLMFMILKIVHKLATGQAILTIIIAIVVMGIVGMILSPVSGIRKGNVSIPAGYGMDKDFKMDFKGENGAGSVKVENGKVKIQTENGGSMEMEVPNQ